MKTQ
ncbi:Protein of unknown function [Lactobacillus helveticus CIRM-BIA 951]|jgi:Ca2+-binding EF-hand superfamily protein